MGYNKEFLDDLTVFSAILGVVNYYENLTQSDKDDIMHALDEQTKSLLQGVNEKLDEQNEMLRKILDKLD